MQTNVESRRQIFELQAELRQQNKSRKVGSRPRSGTNRVVHPSSLDASGSTMVAFPPTGVQMARPQLVASPAPRTSPVPAEAKVIGGAAAHRLAAAVPEEAMFITTYSQPHDVFHQGLMQDLLQLERRGGVEGTIPYQHSRSVNARPALPPLQWHLAGQVQAATSLGQVSMLYGVHSELQMAPPQACEAALAAFLSMPGVGVATPTVTPTVVTLPSSPPTARRGKVVSTPTKSAKRRSAAKSRGAQVERTRLHGSLLQPAAPITSDTTPAAVGEYTVNLAEVDRATRGYSLPIPRLWPFPTIAARQHYTRTQRSIVQPITAVVALPKSTTWIQLRRNVAVEDDTVLRYVPYFGDDDSTGVEVTMQERLSSTRVQDCVRGAAEELVRVVERPIGVLPPPL